MSFRVKGQKALGSLLIMLLVAVALFGMMARLVQSSADLTQESSPRDALKEIGDSYIPDEMLKPFRSSRFQESVSTEKIAAPFGNVIRKMTLTNHETLLRYMNNHLTWKQVTQYPDLAVGVMLPAHIRDIFRSTMPDALGGFPLWTAELQDGVRVQMALPHHDIPQVGEGGAYADTVYLGTPKGHDDLHLAVPSQVFPYGNLVQYPLEASDEAAISQILDEMEAPYVKVARHPTPGSFYHFMGKVQRGDYDDVEVNKNVGYGDLIYQADKWRGKKVSFLGTLISLRRHAVYDELVPPGRDFYWRGYMLNSDRQTYIFASIEKPDAAEGDLVYMEGCFLQRTNYIGSHKNTVWVPLVIASMVKKVEEQSFDFTAEQKLYLLLFFLFFVAILIYFSRLSGKKSDEFRSRVHKRAAKRAIEKKQRRDAKKGRDKEAKDDAAHETGGSDGTEDENREE